LRLRLRVTTSCGVLTGHAGRDGVAVALLARRRKLLQRPRPTATVARLAASAFPAYRRTESWKSRAVNAHCNLHPPARLVRGRLHGILRLALTRRQSSAPEAIAPRTL
jgi:hypothetical protein